MRKGIVILSVTGLLAGLAACWFAGSYLIAPVPERIGPPPSELPATDVILRTNDGRTVRGWFVPGQEGRGAVLLLHPLRTNRRFMLGRARFLNRAGYAVLLVDLLGHGETPGDYLTFGHLEARDAEAAVRYLHRRLPGEKIGIIGVSLGGAALLLGPAAQSADAVVLESVFTSLAEATENRLAVYFGAPGRYLSPLLLWQVKPRLGIDPNALAPLERIGGLTAPLLMIAGSADRRVTIEQSRRLFARAPEPKSLWIIDGARHQDLHRVAGGDYERRVLDFFARHLR